MSAAAVDDTQQADTIASVIADAAPTEEKVVAPDAVTTSSVSFAGHNEVTVPIDAHAPVTIESADSKVDIALPSEINVSDGVVADDGTVVFEDNGNHAHAAVQALDDGSVRLQTVLDSPHAPSTYTYAFGGDTQLILLDDGTVEVTETITDGVSATIGLVDAPWAIDATGTTVPTHYTVDGNTLTQHVDHSDDYAYPITADPSYSVGIGFYIHWTRAETATLAGYGVAGMTAATAACAWMGTKLAPPYGSIILGAGCAYVAIPLIHQAGVAQNSSPKRCAYTRYIPLGGVVVSGTYKDSRCR